MDATQTNKRCGTGPSAALSAYFEEEDRADVGARGRGRTGRHRSLRQHREAWYQLFTAPHTTNCCRQRARENVDLRCDALARIRLGRAHCIHPWTSVAAFISKQNLGTQRDCDTTSCTDNKRATSPQNTHHTIPWRGGSADSFLALWGVAEAPNVI